MSPMFIASKLLSFATQPLAWVGILLFLGLLWMRSRQAWGKGLCWLALLLLLLQGWQLPPEMLLRELESQYPPVPATADLSNYAGIVVLGGALEPAYVLKGNDQPALNNAAERMTAPVALMKHNPHLQLLFTGGSGELTPTSLTEADRAKVFFDNMGVPASRVMYESASTNTYENAVLSAALPGVKPARPWLLLTSASHMPRAMATFRQAGWNVTAYPVDYRAGRATPWTEYSLQRGAELWHLGLHEWIGLLAYQHAGQADTLRH
jgi:uncharacterized SAM-binding protein YcdF (DUF218 family)